MDPSSGQHQQMSSQSIENMLASSKSQQQQEQEMLKKPRPQPEQALNCPRCNSTNTKFCYYNNYSLSQPRYFCKSCRRYWTKGGTLRNVPVGGGCRKNKRPSSQSSKRSQDQAFPHNIINNPLTHFSYDHNNTSDFTLLASLARLQKQNGQLGFDEIDHFPINNPTNTNCDILGMNNLNSTNPSSGFLDVLRNGFLGTSPNPNTNNNMGNLYYGYGNGDMGEVVENGNSNNNNNGEMVLPYDEEMSGNSVATTQAVTVTTMKQEMCHNGGDNGNNKVLWGFPWQINGGGDTNIMGEVDHSARASWNNGLNSSNWHGLLNSPLM